MTTAARGEPIVIRARLVTADVERAETIATGEVLGGSTLGDSEFCTGGTILDSHASPDPDVLLIARTITCPDGTVQINVKPEVSPTGKPEPGQPQTGSWTIVGGTGEFEGLRGSGEMEVVYDPDPAEPARATLTGTTTR